MKIIFTGQFKKGFNRIPKKIQQKFKERIDLFIQNPFHPLLKIHPLKGNMLGLRAFSVTGDYRVIYRIVSNDTVKLINIGTRAQIY